jgi:hypothetical protein
MKSGTAIPIPQKLYPNAHWYFALAIVVTWVGFSTSYFTKLKQTDIYHHIHGATAGLWMVTLLVQPLLYKYGYIDLHRKIGRMAVYILVPLLFLGGITMMRLMVQGQAHYPPGSVYQLAWIDACSLLVFPFFVILSILRATNIQLHARYMACTVLVLLPPAITRLLFFIPWFDSFSKTLNGSYVLIYMALLLLLADDRRTGGIRKPYVIAFILFVLTQISMNFAGGWGWWHHVLNTFSGYRAN